MFTVGSLTPDGAWKSTVVLRVKNEIYNEIRKDCICYVGGNASCLTQPSVTAALLKALFGKSVKTLHIG